MSDRRNKKSKSGRSPDRSRSRSPHRKKSDKQKSKKSKKYKRSYSRSSSRSRSNSSKRSRSSSKSPSQRKGYGSRYDRKLEQYSPEKEPAPAIPAEDEYRPQQSDSNCLVLTDLSDDITQDELQDMLQDLAISLGTSPPDSIQMVAILKTAYVMFPSVASAKKILYSLKGKLVNDKVNISMEFYPTNLTGQGQKQSSAQAQDVSLVQDWICDKCHYKNFAKRGKCNRCENSRNSNCKVVFNSASYVKQSGPPGSGQYFAQGEKGEGPQSSSSLMVRGGVLQDTDETDLLDYFNQFAPVKDIRMVRNKQTGKYREFAFIEFYSVEEAESIMNRAQEMEFRIGGQPISLAFSRTKRREDEAGQGGQEETTTSPYPGYQQSRKNKGAGAATTQNAYGQDVNAYLQNAAAMNALDPQTAAYYQNYYQQLYGQGAAGMQQYMQNYGQAYNYSQTATTYGTQGYNVQNYANYGYNTTTTTQNYATNQNYNQQQQLQQLQQQLQPSTIQQAVPTQTTQAQAQNPPQTQTILPGLGGTSSINPAVTSEKKVSTEIATEQPATKTMEVESTPVVQENKGEEKSDQMVLEEKNEGENKINEETQTEGGNVPPATGENIVVEEKKVEEKKVLSKAEIEKNKRKQIELEMKKWEREQQMKALFGTAQEEEQQQQGQEQGKKAEGKTQEGDKFAPMQVQSKQKTSIFTNVESAKPEKVETELPKKEVVSYKVFLGDVPVCKLCKRKFNDEYSIKLHEKFSSMHRENLSKIAS